MRPVCTTRTARTHTPPWSEQSYALQKRTIDELSCESVLKWWKRWMSSYPLLARATRVVFGAPASAAYVEMILFLHGNLDLIPDDIPALPTDGPDSATNKHMPGRLKNPNPKLERISGAFGPVDLTEEDEGDDEDEENEEDVDDL
ncbi:unnamed protein product [Ectocarpus sp. CCAP 1310/34]|nr:unnamed protein product [Ectocarpus sp. CCAP 1310/34]